MGDRDDGYVQKFVDAVAAAGIGVTVTADDVRAAARRQDLGITSLNIIVVIASYLQAGPNRGTAPRAEWVPRLDEVDGILSVLEEIDRTPQAAPVP
jgi:hypothetical protein